jgi:hypothetical protein
MEWRRWAGHDSQAVGERSKPKFDSQFESRGVRRLRAAVGEHEIYADFICSRSVCDPTNHVANHLTNHLAPDRKTRGARQIRLAV